MSWRDWLSYSRAALGIMHGSRAFGGPVQAIFLITNRCNIRYIHCYFHSPRLESPNLRPLRRARQMSLEAPSREDLRGLQRLDADPERTSALIGQLTAMGTRRFQFTGNGEPFLHRSLFEFLARAKSGGATCTIATAGHMLDRDKIDALIDLGVDKLKVTTLAGTREKYLRAHRGVKETAFDELRENLLYLSERKRALGARHPKLSMCNVVLAETYDGLLEFARFAAQVGAEKVKYRPMDDLEDPNLAPLVPTAEQAAHVREQLVEVKDYLESRGVDHNLGKLLHLKANSQGRGVEHNISHFLKVFREQLDTTALYHVIPCHYGWLSVVVSPDGMVYPCSRGFGPLGDVYERDFREIWYGEGYRRFRKEASTINKRRTPASGADCFSCSHYNLNLRIYGYLHPIKGRSARTEGLRPRSLTESEV